MYMRAGGLFHNRNPIVDPAKTIAIAAIRTCPLDSAINVKVRELIAIVPDAPPSILSKKLIELVTPTNQKTVTAKSITRSPEGEPKVFVTTKIDAENVATIFCATKRGHGLSWRTSSINPMVASKTAGTKMVLARRKVCFVKLVKNADP